MRVPFHRKKMKVVSEVSFFERIASAHPTSTSIVGTMDRGMDSCRFTTNILHDIDLATLRPAYLINILTQHPERGPDPLARRYLHACLNAAIAEGKLSLGDQASGSVAARAIPAGIVVRILQASFDHQMALPILVRIVVRIILEFLISPASPSEFRSPPALVGFAARCALKVVMPNQLPRR